VVKADVAAADEEVVAVGFPRSCLSPFRSSFFPLPLLWLALASLLGLVCTANWISEVCDVKSEENDDMVGRASVPRFRSFSLFSPAPSLLASSR
jgi:hypothetical protein